MRGGHSMLPSHRIECGGLNRAFLCGGPLVLVDRFGRNHTSLRVSVTDRCNLRCTYCMPAETPDYCERHAACRAIACPLLRRFTERQHELGCAGRSILFRSYPAAWTAASDWRKGCIGIIASVTEPFCGTCNRFRLTADGQLRNCLFGNDSGDVRSLLRSGGNDASIAKLMIDAVAAKKRGHGTDDLSFGHTSRPMYSIGG